MTQTLPRNLTNVTLIDLKTGKEVGYHTLKLSGNSDVSVSGGNGSPIIKPLKKTINVVSAIIVNSYGQILVAKRSPAMGHPDYWEFPGGKVEETDKDFEEALIREIKEELNADFHLHTWETGSVYEYDDKIVDICVGTGYVTNDHVECIEHSELQWLYHEELKAYSYMGYMLPSNVSIVEDLLWIIKDYQKEFDNKIFRKNNVVSCFLDIPDTI